MSKYTYKEIKEIIQATPVEFAKWSDDDFFKNGFGAGLTVGYFSPSDTNWSYKVRAYTKGEGKSKTAFLVVQVFDSTKTK